MSTSGLPPRPPAKLSMEVLKRLAKERHMTLLGKQPRAKLADAQLLLAREYGFASWRALAASVGESEWDKFRELLQKNDVMGARRLLKDSPRVRRRINDPIGYFGARPVHMASNHPDMMDVLLDYGADINLRSDWEKGPFSVLDSSNESATRHYLSRGATLTAHAAARLGWIGELRSILAANPAVVHERGGDGQQPLHFAKTPEIVDLLLGYGAEIDARCVDHHSTPAQYALGDRADVCRHLLARGATADIFMAAKLGDIAVASRLADADAYCLAARINKPGYAASVPFNIYCWSIGWYLSPHEVALQAGQHEMFAFLSDRSSTAVQFLVACNQAGEAAARQMLAAEPGLLDRLSPEDHGLMAYALFYRREAATKLMLSLGFDPAARGMDGFDLLHIACWHGYDGIVRQLLADHRQQIDLEDRSNKHEGTPLGTTMHGSQHSFAKAGDYAAIVRMLVEAGAKLPDTISSGSEAVRAELRKYGVPGEQ